MIFKAKWIKAPYKTGYVATVFKKNFTLKDKIKKANLFITAMGTYEALINEERVGEFILAPGNTAFTSRLQYQSYDVSKMLKEENEIKVTISHGWYYITLMKEEQLKEVPCGFIATLNILYENGTEENVITDESWFVSESKIRQSEIYLGEICDATFEEIFDKNAICFDGPTHTLIKQEGVEIREQEFVKPKRIFKTPNGETVIDFGQNLAGYVMISLSADEGDVVDLSYGEVLDKNGNFYNENYGAALSEYHYICKKGEQTYKPKFTFCGFRYVRINSFPKEPETNDFTAVVLYSQMDRIGEFECSDEMVNKLYNNVLWSQKSNFIDIPSDCPQRCERLGWTADLMVFTKTACRNFNVEKFLNKWLGDVVAEQGENGYVPNVIPDIHKNGKYLAGWGDVCTLTPWDMYMEYGSKDILEKMFTTMKKWVDFITTVTTTQYLWTSGKQLGDWLALDGEGNYGASRTDLIATVFYARSAEILYKTGEILGEDVKEYEDLYNKIKEAFRKEFTEYKTQTECVLALYFNLAEDKKKVAEKLNDMINECGHLKTGFLGTPYLMYALSENGYSETAYSLLLRKEFPSWLYPITKGATTTWERWDGIKPDGDFREKEMNSFNHYAYGSVADWLYSAVLGINPLMPGYEKVKIAPITDNRLNYAKGSLKTKYGEIKVSWQKTEKGFTYRINTPVDGILVLDDKEYEISAGEHMF